MLNHAHKIHCIGIGGIGVSALAQLWHAQGKEVSGSDAEASEITKALEAQGISVHLGSISNFKFPISNIDVVVYSDAVPEDHPDRVAARERGVPEMSYAQALGEVSRAYRTVVVTGTHGKSTTTALLGLMLEAAGMDPLVIVGTKVPGWPLGNLRLSKTLTSNPLPKGEGVFKAIPSPRGRGEGEGKQWFVVEGDDYRDHFLELVPYAVVVTNIEYDHPDYFRDLAHTVESFRKLVEKVPEGGFVVINEDDAGCHELMHQIDFSHSERSASEVKNPARKDTGSFAPTAASGLRMTSFGRRSEIFSNLPIQVPGEFNRYNATAAATAAMELGVAREAVEKVAREFKGVWRRFEVVGNISTTHNPSQPPLILRGGDDRKPPLKVRGGRGSYESHDDVLAISDYGHHPTAIRATMKAAREAYPGRRLVLVYQPHQHSRTKHLFNDFVEVLKDAADVVIVSDIYAVKGRMEEQDINSQMLVDQIKNVKLKMQNVVLHGGNLDSTKHVVLEQMKPGDVVIFMGAGDIDSLARKIVKIVKKAQ